MTSVGRNDPCPCGSGKKYKKCCLAREREATGGEWVPPPELARVGGRLLDWARRPEWRERWDEVIAAHTAEILEAEEMELEDLAEMFGADLLGAVVGVTLEDLATRRFDEAPENLIDDYLARRGWSENAVVVEYLEAMRGSHASAYEVVEVDPGLTLGLRDLLRPAAKIEVRERSASRQLVRWDVLVARVVRCAGHDLLTGATLPYSREAAEELQGMVARTMARSDELISAGLAAVKEQVPEVNDEDLAAIEITEETVRADLFRVACPHMTRLWLAELLARARRPAPHMVNYDGHDVVFTEVRFKIGGDAADAGDARKAQEALIERLDACAQLEREQDDAAAWVWSRRRRDSDPAAGEHVSLGRLELKRKHLLLECNSRERGEQGKQLVEALLADLCEPGVMSLEDVDVALARHREGAGARSTRSSGRDFGPVGADFEVDASEGPTGPPFRPSSAISSPEEARGPALSEEDRQRLELEFKTHHYSGWLDEKLPALGNKTPRRAARSAAGRADLVALLKDMENLELRGAARGRSLPYDFSWMWEELGIEREG